MLVVIGIIGLLAVVVTPAFQSINRASGITDAAAQIAAAIERTRAEAVARNTFAWLAIERFELQGNRSLRLGTVVSQDGSTDFSEANTQAIGPAMVIDRVDLLDCPAAPSGATQLSSLGGAPIKVGAHGFSGGHVLTFTPGGEVTKEPQPTRSTGFAPLVVARFVGAMGTTLDENNPVDLLLDGSTGFSTLQRP